MPPVLAAIVARLMAKNAEDRYQSARGLAHDLRICRERLQRTGAIERFELGTQDRIQRLRVPEKLYGRDAERGFLFEAWDAAAAGAFEFVVVSGYSGVGKTSLVGEIQPRIAAERGAFVAGKFEQFSRGTPYASLLQAFGGFIRHLLTGSEDHVATWRARISDALAADGAVLCDVVRELAILVGQQPPAPDLPPAEAANRFQLVFRRFVRALAAPDRPLVLFLDDLQWADVPTLTLLEGLAADPDFGNLLVIGAYRDNEVDHAHALALALRRIEAAGKTIRAIRLRPLSATNVQRIVADTLTMTSDDVATLADRCFAKTRGNPFFLTQFVESLHRDGLLTPDGGSWRWDVAQIAARDVTDNVVDFLAARLSRLSVSTRAALGRAAFIGTDFDVATVAALLDEPVSGVMAALADAIDEDMVTVTSHFSGRCRFAHDRVQQAAYQLVGSEQRPSIHRALGISLLDRRASGEDIAVFAIANHLNAGASELDDEQRKTAARLNLEAGRLGLSAAAYAPSHRYFQAGIGALADDCWATDYELSLALHLGGAEAAYLSHNTAAMEALIGVVLEQARSELDKVAAHEVAIYAMFAAGRYGETIDRGLDVLELLGVTLPAHPEQDDVVAGLTAALGALDGVSADAIYAMDAVSDDRILAACRILNTLTSPAYFGRPSLLPLLAFELVLQMVKRGIAPESQYGLAVMGLVLCTIGDLERGRWAGELALRLRDRSNNPRLDNLTLHVCTMHIRFWSERWHSLVETEREVFRDGHDLGDFLFACFGANAACLYQLFNGTNLGALQAESEEVATKIRRLDQAIPALLHRLLRQYIDALVSGPDDPRILRGRYVDETIELPRLIEAGDLSNAFVLNVFKTNQCYLLGEYEAAAAAATANQAFGGAAASSPYIPIHTWMDGLAQLAAFDSLPADEQPAIRERIEAARTTLAAWAEFGPVNYAHRLALLDAEIARQFGDDAFHAHYANAIQLAADGGWLHDQAMANERAGLAYAALGNTTIARAYLAEARHLYDRWGAAAKVDQMTRRHPLLLGAPTARVGTTQTTITGTGSVEVDTVAVIQASRALSQEIKLSRLVEKLLRIALEMSGARNGALFRMIDEQLTVEADGTSGVDIVIRHLSAPAEEWSGCPAAILRYVQRTGSAVVLADAATSTLFADDADVRDANPGSVLCVPLQRQGRLTAILFLSNDQTTDVFTPERVEPLELVLAQAAISLENAALYDSLEAKVIERTQQLEEARERSDELLRNILPESIAEELKAIGRSEPVAFDAASVLFTDFVGFTQIAEQMSAGELVSQLDRAFSRMDEIAGAYGLEKLKTIGDSYMCVGGIPSPNRTHAVDCILAGLAFQRIMGDLKAERAERGLASWEVRVGIHTGPLVAGVIGRRKFAYDVWGDTVNIASRMESSGVPGRVNISAAMYRFAEALFVCTDRGAISAKHKGEIQMYFVDRLKPEYSADARGTVPNSAFDAARARVEAEN